jgi:hypothetical protein
MAIRIPITAPAGGINADKLRAELVAVYADVLGISAHNGYFVDLITDSPVTQQQLQTIVDLHNAAVLTTEQQITAAQAGLRDKVSLAETHATTIKVLFNAVLDQTINQTVQPTRFDNLKTVIQNAAPAFRDRLITDCVQELGFDPTGVLSAAQIRQATLYVRAWVTGLALLLTVT